MQLPAAACGITALRPRTGVLPVAGVYGLAPYADTPGPMAATVANTVKLWDVLADTDGVERRGYESLAGMTIGVVEETPLARQFEQYGARLVAVEYPHGWFEHFWNVFWFQAASLHRERFETAPEGYGEGVRKKLEGALKVTEGEYRTGLQNLAVLKQQFSADTSHLNFIVSETLGAPLPLRDVDELAIREQLGRLTAPPSALDLAGFALGNLQIIAADEDTAISAALFWEQLIGGIPEPDLA